MQNSGTKKLWSSAPLFYYAFQIYPSKDLYVLGH